MDLQYVYSLFLFPILEGSTELLVLHIMSRTLQTWIALTAYNYNASYMLYFFIICNLCLYIYITLNLDETFFGHGIWWNLLVHVENREIWYKCYSDPQNNSKYLLNGDNDRNHCTVHVIKIVGLLEYWR
jgi:hypothetical protein